MFFHINLNCMGLLKCCVLEISAVCVHKVHFRGGPLQPWSSGIHSPFSLGLCEFHVASKTNRSRSPKTNQSDSETGQNPNPQLGVLDSRMKRESQIPAKGVLKLRFPPTPVFAFACMLGPCFFHGPCGCCLTCCGIGGGIQAIQARGVGRARCHGCFGPEVAWPGLQFHAGNCPPTPPHPCM